MKKILFILLIALTALSVVGAQDIDFTDFEDDFAAFSDDLAGALPAASTIGLNWSDAYIGGGKLPPDLGVGLTVGFTSLPSDSFAEIADLLGVDLPSFFESSLGVPLPVYTFDARLAIPLIPIPLDAGFKVGFLDPEWSSTLTLDAAAIDYLLVGGDVRYAILEENLLLPSLSVGIGYNYLRGGLYISDVVSGQTIDMSSYGVDDITVSDGDLFYEWESHVIDIKVQASKKLLIFTPSVGLGYSYGWSTAGGGIDASITSTSDLSDIEDATGLDLSSQSLSISSDVDGGALRVWGGGSVNLLLLRLDLAVMYNVFSESLGGSLNARIQI